MNIVKDTEGESKRAQICRMCQHLTNLTDEAEGIQNGIRNLQLELEDIEKRKRDVKSEIVERLIPLVGTLVTGGKAYSVSKSHVNSTPILVIDNAI